MKTQSKQVSRFAPAVLAALLSGAAAQPCLEASLQTKTPSPGSAAFDYAFKFASAITSDPKDRAQAQEEVVLDSAAAGALDEAARRAELIEGWRRGTALADLAGLYAGAGRMEEARVMLGKAESLGKSVEGWQGPRIAAHVTRARAIMGDVEAVTAAASELAKSDPRQYSGQVAAATALGDAARGEFAAAMQALARLDGDPDFDVAWWRTKGYLDVARQAALKKPERQQALAAARRSADGVAGWMRADVLVDIADESQAEGDATGARAALKAADGLATSIPDSMPVKASVLSKLAGSLARAGDLKRGRALLKTAEAGVPSTLVISRPGLYATIGSAYWAIGDSAEAARLQDQALSTAEALTNARPRALAMASICRTFGRDGVPLDDGTRARLEALYGGLKDPW